MELKGKDLMNFGLLKGYAENELREIQKTLLFISGLMRLGENHQMHGQRHKKNMIYINFGDNISYFDLK